jgi:S-adenosylmethionine-diacylglycerol 3-amino-3-carboxypropyl transferase
MSAFDFPRIAQVPSALSLIDRFDQKVFNALYARSLVYNTCWEDPAVDRKALRLTPDDVLLVITSAGCNVLDYALQGPRTIHAVDANPRQTALLELKLAAIRHLDFEDFFAIFGDGFHARFRDLYRQRMRSDLSEFARAYWDRHGKWFTSRYGSFYFHGLSGFVARGFRTYFRMRPQLARDVQDLLACDNLEAQRQIYNERIASELWTPTIKWVLSRQLTMSLLGVPHPQRRLVQAQHPEGVAGFIRDAIEYVFRNLPVAENYFWRVYLNGHYTTACCPEYLKRDNFVDLKQGLVDCIELHTSTVTEFLQSGDTPISRYVLLDHMDWMSSYHPAALIEEWNAILECAAPGARILLRSAHANPPFLDWVEAGASHQRLAELLHFDRDLARAYLRRMHDRGSAPMISPPALAADARTLWRLLRGQPRQGSHAERLEAFYAPQAATYDAFRARLLHGRDEMIDRLEIPHGAHVVELGCGTGSSLEILGERIDQVAHMDLVDLCPALLAVARQRAAKLSQVSVIEADATNWQPQQSVDCVFLSYALTMMPAWRKVIDNACQMLTPGGRLGVVDFHLPAHGSRLGNACWRQWFGHDGVHLSADHLATLQQTFPAHISAERRAPVPYLPGLRAPYYWFVGKRPGP